MKCYLISNTCKYVIIKILSFYYKIEYICIFVYVHIKNEKTN